MPLNKNIKSILIPGSGPIVIGQACEFDYSGTQACKVLRKEGIRTILLNSNPASIMTDPELADATYIEPLTVEAAEQIIAKEKPDALLPTVGGQTALNLTMELHEKGILDQHKVKLLGAGIDAIRRAESRQEFKKIMEELGLRVPSSRFCHSISEAKSFRKEKGLPLIIRPSFTLGGTGGGIAATDIEFEEIVFSGLNSSPLKEILIEESVLGWKEYELELMRDLKDNVVVICSIENLDPMGVHTGDSITVAPQQSLSDRQYQAMRNAAIKIIRAIGVATGGSNIQFAVNPHNGEMVVIEMNPRVSRSSALASKATGFPIAKIAAQLAIGYTLDELRNEITKVTVCSFEPSIDYVVCKAPRFAFEKFPESENTLGTMMRSVGETMSIGRTFKESLQKALRSLEIARFGLGSDGYLEKLLYVLSSLSRNPEDFYSSIEESLRRPNPNRIFAVKSALELEYSFACYMSSQALQTEKKQSYAAYKKKHAPFSVKRVAELSGIDPWFLYQIRELVEIEDKYLESSCPKDPESLRYLKQCGYTDRQIAFLSHRQSILDLLAPCRNYIEQKIQKKIGRLLEGEERAIRSMRYKAGIVPSYKRIDTCAGEFESHTPYLYASYEEEDEAAVSKKRKVIILGGGPNRIGQGIEFDYCCCHASFALQEMGIEAIMVNSNPETVSTDYDMSDKLYFEALCLEDILHIYRHEKAEGLILSFGGQSPLGLARALDREGVPILGTSADTIDRAENRDRFAKLLKKLQLEQAPGGIAYSFQEAREVVQQIGYPVLVRPSYVLGGRAMVIVYNEKELKTFMKQALFISPEHPILIDRFLERAVEIDVDSLCDGKDVFVAGIMQHIEEAGVHSGDSACVLPPVDIADAMLRQIKEATRRIALELGIKGLLNIQFALYQNELFVIEVNPRASRTIPFLSKAIGLALARLATRIMCGQSLQEIQQDKNLPFTQPPKTLAVKEVVLPFARFPGSDIILGPEMKSTGEVMGIGRTLGEAYIKAQLGAGEILPETGKVFFSICEEAKELLLEEARSLLSLGFMLYSTQGTASFLRKAGLQVSILHKLKTRHSPNPLEMIQAGKIQLIINIPNSRRTRDDALLIRQEAVRRRLLCVTTVAGSKALVHGLKERRAAGKRAFSLASLQELHSIQKSAAALPMP